MKTLTINTAGKRATAYTLVDFKTQSRINIPVKEAKKLADGKEVFSEVTNAKTYKLD